MASYYHSVHFPLGQQVKVFNETLNDWVYTDLVMQFNTLALDTGKKYVSTHQILLGPPGEKFVPSDEVEVNVFRYWASLHCDAIAIQDENVAQLEKLQRVSE